MKSFLSLGQKMLMKLSAIRNSASILQQIRYAHVTKLGNQAKGLLFRQLFHDASYTYTYFLGCAKTRKAVVIDPVLEMVDRDIKFIEEMNLKLVYGLNTHVHADHVTGTGKLKQRIPGFQSVLSKASGGKADMLIEDGEVIQFGEQSIHCSATPGHTNGCMTYILPDHSMAFTGDALLIRACGRTDFQQGNAGQLYDSVYKRIFSLPDHYFLYPGHDYMGFSVTTVAEEKVLNPRLTLSRDEFINFMKELNLKYPKLIDIAVPTNLKCGEISKEALQGSAELLSKK
uniref:Persulfide dioxygenase ETHE1, mitochondrial n=1 Tax=Phallusia mammillata TaxID=59560 RepID=A0A6F9DCS8_9ASCI|nr:persulfide dioxygenase ETHE1, mitochondrial-like [Phallusia mammillata]